jgi:hypothetical protein
LIDRGLATIDEMVAPARGAKRKSELSPRVIV